MKSSSIAELEMLSIMQCKLEVHLCKLKPHSNIYFLSLEYLQIKTCSTLTSTYLGC